MMEKIAGCDFTCDKKKKRGRGERASFEEMSRSVILKKISTYIGI